MTAASMMGAAIIRTQIHDMSVSMTISYEDLVIQPQRRDERSLNPNRE
jgi:hypothetical protein